MNTAQSLAARGIPLPPQSFMDASVAAGLDYGTAMLRQIERLGANVSEGLFLDIGCGWGRVALALAAEGFPGTYVGLDVLKKRTDWLSANVTPKLPSFRFYHTDVANDRYNKSGAVVQTDLSQIVGDPVRTCAMLSVFTHMWEDDIEHYLRGVRSVIAPDGIFVFTAFVLTDAALEGIFSGASKYPMAYYRGEHCRYFNEENPLHAVSYDAGFLDNLIRRTGWEPAYHFGRWSGASQKGQDWVVARPA